MKNLNKMTLDEMIDEYSNSQDLIKTIEARNDELKERILDAMKAKGMERYVTPDNVVASAQAKELVRYTDVAQLVSRLQTLGLVDYLKTTPNTTELNKQLRANTTLKEALKDCYRNYTSIALTIKKV